MVHAELLIYQNCEEYKINKGDSPPEPRGIGKCLNFKMIPGALEGCVWCYNWKENGRYIKEYERKRDKIT